MTASELRAIMQGVPRAAIGDDVTWTTDPENALFFIRGGIDFIPVSVAESAFVGSMTAWLCGDLRIKYRQADDGEMAYKVKASDGCVTISGDNRRLVAALAAACKEVGGDG